MFVGLAWSGGKSRCGGGGGKREDIMQIICYFDTYYK